VEQASAAAQSLNDQAKVLNQLVSTFRLDDAAGAVAQAPVPRQKSAAAKPLAAHSTRTKLVASAKDLVRPKPAERAQVALPAGSANDDWEEF
jgi:hypothetical protein